MCVKATAAMLVLAWIPAWGGPGDAQIQGDYLEVRTADVYTGPCFANSEVNLGGKEAILAWRVRQGDWQGVSLDGLSVVLVVRASATLGDPFASPYPLRSVLVVDERADPPQRQALLDLARSLSGDLLGESVSVEPAPIHAEFVGVGAARLVVPGLAEVATRGLGSHDQICGNEEVYYPPLVRVSQAVPAFATAHAFRGRGLGGTWSSPGKRSAFVGTFAF